MSKILGALWMIGVGIAWLIVALNAVGEGNRLNVIGWVLFSVTIGQIIIAAMWLFHSLMEPAR